MLKESQQSKNLTIPNVGISATEIGGQKNTRAVVDLGSPPVNAIWLIDFLVIKYSKFNLSRFGAQKLNTEATPIGRVLAAGVVIGEVQAQKAEYKPTDKTVSPKELGPLTLAFQFTQPPIVPFGQSLVAEVELEGIALAAGGSGSSAALGTGILSMGYTYKQLRGYGDKPKST